MRPRSKVIELSLAALCCCAPSDVPSRADALAQAIFAQQVEHFVRTFGVVAPALAVQRAEERAHAPSIRALVEQGRLDFEPDPQIRELVTLLFAERDYEHLFVAGSRLTPDGVAVSAAILQADLEALDPAPLHAALLHEKLDRLSTAGDSSAFLADLSFDAEEEERVLAFVRSHAALDGTLPAHEAVFELLAAGGGTNPVPEFARAIDGLAGQLSRVAEQSPEIELILAAGFVRYAIANRLSNLHYVTPAEAEANGWRVRDAAHRDEILRALAGASFRRGQQLGFATELAALRPAFEQYPRLVAGLARYRAIRDAGGWGTLSASRTIEVGDRSPAIPALRRRLSAEGYFEGDLDSDLYDEMLEPAVRAYQSTHQLHVNGDVAEEMVTSLNIPVERRIAQIEVTLDRWRRTRRAASAGQQYIFVNIPDFYAELWDADTLVYRWKVIVGRDQNRRDEDGNARGQTPLFSDVMEFVVFNPYWNVPDTIRAEEYDPLIAEDPNWLANNGFEIALEGGREWLRQVPGPGNALGVVKFLFPNEHDVYMHDTPTKDLFNRPTRAYSHGCMRVHEPLQLAEVLLSRDRGWSPAETRSYMRRQQAREGEQWVGLDHPLPIHIEYFSVRGDEEGRIHFLADPYRMDRPLVDARLSAAATPPGPVAPR